MVWLPSASGKTAALCLLWYTALAVTSQTTKTIMTEMHYPFCLELLQFLFAAVLLAVLMQTARFSCVQDKFPPGILPELVAEMRLDTRLLLKVMPLGMLQFCGKYFLLLATLLISVASVASVKLLTPMLLVAGYRVVYGVRFPAGTYLLLVPLVAGVAVMLGADTLHTEWHWKGVLLSGVSSVVLASQQMYGKELVTWAPEGAADLALNPASEPVCSPAAVSPADSSESVSSLEEKDYFAVYEEEVHASQCLINPFARLLQKLEGVRKPDKLTAVMYVSLVGFVFLTGGFSVQEAMPMYRAVLEARDAQDEIEVGRLLLLVMASGTAHFMQMVLAFMLLGSLPALTFSIALLMKRIVVILVSIMVASKVTNSALISPNQVVGLVLIGAGLYLYDRWGSHVLT